MFIWLSYMQKIKTLWIKQSKKFQKNKHYTVTEKHKMQSSRAEEKGCFQGVFVSSSKHLKRILQFFKKCCVYSTLHQLSIQISITVWCLSFYSAIFV